MEAHDKNVLHLFRKVNHSQYKNTPELPGIFTHFTANGSVLPDKHLRLGAGGCLVGLRDKFHDINLSITKALDQR